MNTTAHRPFSYIVAFYSSGIILNHFIRLPFNYICLCVYIFLFLAVMFSKRAFTATIFLLICIAGLGMVYTQSLQYPERDDIRRVARYYRNKPVKVKGAIVSDVEKSEWHNRIKTSFTLEINEILAKWGWQKKRGMILVNIFNDTDIVYGDQLMIEGKLHRPYNFSNDKNFSYRDYLDRRGTRYILSIKKDAEITVLERNKGNAFKAFSLRLRNNLKNVLSRHLSKNEAGIMRAILLGDRTGIPRSIRLLFVQTGTAHILAISGLHIGIVAAFFLVFAKILPIGRRGQFSLVILLLIGYAFLTGGRPSVIRATIMTVVFLTSFIIEKEMDALNTLCLAAVIILLINPLNLFDVGFQLSFICVYAIIHLHLRMPLKDRCASRWFAAIRQSLYISLAVWISVAGLIAYYFGIVTPVTVLANLLVVPLIGVIVALGFGLLFVGFILPSWGYVFADCLKVVLNFLAGFVYLCDKIPFAYIYVREVRLPSIIAYYTVLFILVLIPWGRIDKSVRV